jgi:hypothetical protein
MIYDDFYDIAQRLRLLRKPERPEMIEPTTLDESNYGEDEYGDCEDDDTSYDAFSDRFRGDDN